MTIAVRIAPALLLAAPLTAATNELAQPLSVPRLQLQWQELGSLQPDYSAILAIGKPDPLNPGLHYQPSFANPQPLSPVQLFDSRSMSVQWSADGRVHYRLAVPNPLGAGVGGQLNTNSAKFVLTWPRKK